MILPSHVAILVPSVRKAADHLQQFDFQIDKEVWDGEGTKKFMLNDRPIVMLSIKLSRVPAGQFCPSQIFTFAALRPIPL